MNSIMVNRQLSIAKGEPDVLIVRDLGRMNYADALAIQREAHAEVVASREAARGRMMLLLVEHDPVITISRRPGAQQHLIATDAQLRAAAVEVAETDRGGDITYHGPGQLVVYPILDLNRLNPPLRIESYMRFLEQIVIDVLSQFGIEGMRDAATPPATGVWVNQQPQVGTRRLPPAVSASAPAMTSSSGAKICAIGVRVSRWVSMHGFALNVTTNLDHFNLIVPCGLTGRSVTSMQRELGEQCPTMEIVKGAMIEMFNARMREGLAT